MSITLTGTFTRLDGTPATGTVRVTPSRSPIMDPDGKIVISGPQVFPLDKDGKLAVEIPASNDPDLGSPFTYTVEALLSHKPWKISKVWIPHSSTTVDISEIGDYTPLPGEHTRTVTIPADGEDGQALVWDGGGFSWADPPKGDKGDQGDLEFMSDTPRIENLALGREFEVSKYNTHYITAPIPIAEGDIIYTHRVYSDSEGPDHNITGSIVILDNATIIAYLVSAWRPNSGAKFVKSRMREITDPVPANAVIAVYGEIPAATTRFSDLNIINLTQAYGAGNEPSLEYMDALVEKHGGYIDGEQHVVGDALQALTVAGPGLTLRHDTSVGERVFLDHPGGTTMLHGDTGWRILTSWDEAGTVTGEPLPNDLIPTEGVAGRIAVRRLLDLVTIVVTGVTVEKLDVTIKMPDGFGAGTSTNAMRQTVATSNNTYGVMFAQFGDVFLRMSGAVIDPRNGVGITYPSHQSWPTTLPGTPA